MTRGKILEWVLGISLGGFFIWSGWRKLADLSAFTKSVAYFELEKEDAMGEWFGNLMEAPADAVVAYSLPWFEIFAGLVVVVGFGRAGGLTVLLGMLVSFNLALWSAWNRGITDLKCGCHGVSEDPTNYFWKITSNFAWMAAVLVIFWLIWKNRKLAKE